MNSINVSELINTRPLTRFQIVVAALCFLIVTIDGFDTASIGFIAPAIGAEWGLKPTDMAPLFGAGLFGLMAGAFIFGPLADRFGRKSMLLVSVLFFAAASLAAADAADLRTLVLLRFLTGLGLGGAMPNSITLTSEYCPANHRLFLVTSMFCGFTIGSALGGLASAAMVGLWGWRSVLLAGGVLPIALTPALMWALPESVRFLVLRDKSRARIVAILGRLAPGLDINGASFRLDHGAPAGFPVRFLFRRDLLTGTLLLWVSFFSSLLVIYLLSSWLPSLIKSTGVSLATASLVTAMFQVGGTVGAIALGWFMDKYNPQYVLAICYAAAAVFIGLIGSVSDPVAMAAIIFLAGVGVSGSQVGANALAASFYPTECRATGISWSNAVGRSGSVVGSMGGGWLIAQHLSFSTVFVIVGLPALIGAAAMLTFGRLMPLRRPENPALGARLEAAPFAADARS